MSIFDCISLLGSLGLFLYGMRVMGDGLKKNNGSAMQKALERVTNSTFKSFLLGVLVTALIQSSKATIILTAGLVATGMLTLRQSVGIVLGANVGTTITGQIIRLMDLNGSGGSQWLNFFKPDTLAPFAALVGIVLIMFVKSKNSNAIGEIAMGFGILFTGLIGMTAAVQPLSTSGTFVSLISRFADKPVLAFLLGAAITFITQSSSASVGMVQTLSTTGVLTFRLVFPILLGIYLGECITIALMCAIGTNADAKRTGLVTVVFNCLGIPWLLLVVTVVHRVGLLDSLWDSVMTSGTIANTHTLFNLIEALPLLPIAGVIYNFVLKLIPRKQEENVLMDAVAQKLDEKLFLSPQMALNAAHKVIQVMQRLATDNTAHALELMNGFDPEKAEKLNRSEDTIDRMADAVDEYLIHLSAHVDSEDDSDLLNYYLQCQSEMERIGDLATNLVENAEALKNQHGNLSETALYELSVLGDALSEILEYAAACFGEFDMEAATKIEPLEEVIDDLVAVIKKRHIRRLREGQCGTYTGLTFVDVLTNVERISDQCSNIAIYTLAIHNSQLMRNRHEYIQKLHEGSDAFYNREYERQRAVYLSEFV